MQTQEGARLGKANLSLTDAVAQSVGFIGPVFSAAFFIPTIAGASFTARGAGVATPVAIILAAIGMLGVGWIVSRFAKRVHGAGSLYDYVTDGFGRRAGFVAGWVYYGGMTALTLGIGLAFGGFLSLTLSGIHGIDIGWYWLAIAFWIVAFVMSYLGVQISTRAQLILALVSMVVVFGFSLWVIVQGGVGGNSIAPFNPGKSTAGGIFYGMLYAVIMFIGFETAANLAEETAEPKRSIPRAIFASVIAVTIFYVVVAYALLIAFGRDVSQLLDPANFPPLYVAASNPHLGGATFGEIVQWLVVFDIAAVLLGTATGTSRGIFALARDGRLPKVLAHVQPTRKTPDVASAVLAIGSIAMILIVHWTNGLVLITKTDPGEWFGVFQFGATFGGLCLTLVYLAVSVSGFLGQPGEGRARLAIAGVVGSVVSIAAVYGVVKDAPPVWDLDRIWWFGVIWVGIGVVLMLIFSVRGAFARDTAGQLQTD